MSIKLLTIKQIDFKIRWVENEFALILITEYYIIFNWITVWTKQDVWRRGNDTRQVYLCSTFKKLHVWKWTAQQNMLTIHRRFIIIIMKIMVRVCILSGWVYFIQSVFMFRLSLFKYGIQCIVWFGTWRQVCTLWSVIDRLWSGDLGSVWSAMQSSKVPLKEPGLLLFLPYRTISALLCERYRFCLNPVSEQCSGPRSAPRLTVSGYPCDWR